MKKIKVLDSDITVTKVNDEDFNYGEYAIITSKAHFISENISEKERIEKLNQVAIKQMKILLSGVSANGIKQHLANLKKDGVLKRVGSTKSGYWKINNLITYNDGEIEVSIAVKEDTIWLTQKQISELFGVTKQNISLHTIEIFKSKELEKNSTVKKYLTVQKEGNREVSRELEHYNLDVVISVGYRVNSIKATRFRQWATGVLKEYITKGYAINTHKITEQRLSNLENDMQFVKSNIKNSTLEIKQGIFYDGQIFDAYMFINDLLKNTTKKVTLIDNYIDESTLLFLSKYPNIKFTIITQSISKQLKLDIEKYNKQYSNLIVRNSSKFHDRFLILNEKDTYHLGASLKDLGKKVFAFSKFEDDNLELLLKIGRILKEEKK